MKMEKLSWALPSLTIAAADIYFKLTSYHQHDIAKKEVGGNSEKTYQRTHDFRRPTTTCSFGWSIFLSKTRSNVATRQFIAKPRAIRPRNDILNESYGG